MVPSIKTPGSRSGCQVPPVPVCFGINDRGERFNDSTAGSTSRHLSESRPRRERLNKLLLGAIFVFHSVPVAATVSQPHPIIRFSSGTVAAITSVAVIPARSVSELPPWSWILAYSLWAVGNLVFLRMQWVHLRQRANFQRLYMFSATLLSLHFIIALAQGSDSISDAVTIYGPLLITICEILMALFYHRDAQNVGTEMDTLGGTNYGLDNIATLTNIV